LASPWIPPAAARVGRGLAVSGCATGTSAWEDGAAEGAAERERGAIAGRLDAGPVGDYLERQGLEIQAIPDADVRGDGDALLVAFPGDVMFDVNSHALSPGALSRMDQLAAVLRRYPETEILVKGHTDSTGDEAYNLRLSEYRASSVRKYLMARGVDEVRISAIGLGEAMPLATNTTTEGRALNRRVEFEVRASETWSDRSAAVSRPGGDPTWAGTW